MIILREAGDSIEIDSYYNIGEFAKVVWDHFKNEKPNERKRTNFIVSELKKIRTYNEIVKPIQQLVVKYILDSNIEAIRLLDTITFDIKPVYKNNIEHLMTQIESENIDIRNNDLFRVIVKNEELFDRSFEDFQYTLFILNVFVDKSKLKEYFTDISDLSVNTLMRGNKLLPKIEIHALIDELTKERGTSREQVSQTKKYSLLSFMRTQRINGDKAFMLKEFYKIIKKYFSSIPRSALSDIYVDIFSQLISILKTPKNKNFNFINAHINKIFSTEIFTDVEEVKDCVVEFDTYFKSYLKQNKKLMDLLFDESNN